MPGSALPGLSGLALGLTFTPLGGPLLPFVAFAPVAFYLSASDAPGRGLAAGLVTSVLAHGIGLHWMVPALSWRSTLAIPTYLAVLALIGICGAVALEAAPRLRARVHCPLPLALALTWVGFEWFAARVPGVAYAWLNAGASLAWYPELSWVAGVGGGGALTLWTVLIGSWIGVAASRRVERRAGPARTRGRIPGWAEASAFVLVTLVPVAVGVGEGGAVEDGATGILAVQPGREPPAGGLLAWESRLRSSAGPAQSDLVVFPERFLDRAGPGGAAETLATSLEAAVLFGGLDRRVDAPGDTAWYNAAFLVEPETRGPPQVVHKRHLVPGLEDVGGPGGALLRLPGAGYRPGSGVTVLDVADRSVGVLICYDSAFPSYARALVDRGADLLIVLSNDDWLDPEGPARATVAYWQHETQGRLRARENGVPLVQVAATGRTVAVDARGRTISPGGAWATGVPVFAPAVVPLAVAGAGPATPFRRSGDVLGPVAFALCVLGAWPGRRRRPTEVPNRG